MRCLLVLFSLCFVFSNSWAESHGKEESRQFKTPKDEKVEALTRKILRLEYRELEIGLEKAKWEKLKEGDRTLKQMERELTDLQKELAEKKEELAVTEKLFPNACRGKFVVYQRNTPIHDPDSGFVTGSRLVNYLGCSVVAETCAKNEFPRALVTSYGSDVEEEYLSKASDPREGKECQCFCKRR